MNLDRLPIKLPKYITKPILQQNRIAGVRRARPRSFLLPYFDAFMCKITNLLHGRSHRNGPPPAKAFDEPEAGRGGREQGGDRFELTNMPIPVTIQITNVVRKFHKKSISMILKKLECQNTKSGSQDVIPQT